MHLRNVRRQRSQTKLCRSVNFEKQFGSTQTSLTVTKAEAFNTFTCFPLLFISEVVQMGAPWPIIAMVSAIVAAILLAIGAGTSWDVNNISLIIMFHVQRISEEPCPFSLSLRAAALALLNFLISLLISS